VESAMRSQDREEGIAIMASITTKQRKATKATKAPNTLRELQQRWEPETPW
jgi:hypothetical protein